MEKYIPYEKRSKKQKRALDRAKRGTWGECKPVTRMPANPKAYNRKKARRWRCEDHLRAFCFPAAQEEPSCHFASGML